MPQLIKPGSVKVMTQDGEVQVSIAIELTVNLNTEGLQIAATHHTQNVEKKSSVEDKIDWMIPDFDLSPQVDFGKKE